MNTVQFPRAIVNRLLHLAQASPDEEICGLISRDHRGFKKCHPIANVAGDKKHFFTLEPQAQIASLRTMREQGETLAVIYHSHLNTPSLPSLTDIEQHEYPGVLYLIISLATPGMPEMRGFYIRGRAIEEAAMGVDEEIVR